MTSARNYGEALFLLASEEGTEEKMHTDAECLSLAIKENPDYVKLLNTPAVSREERLALIDRALLGMDKNLINLVKLLSDKHLAHKIPEALSGFFDTYDEAMGICHAEAISARPLTDRELDRLKTNLEAQTGKTVIIKNLTDPTLLGGMKLRYMGREIDGALKTRLDSFEKKLKDTVI